MRRRYAAIFVRTDQSRELALELCRTLVERVGLQPIYSDGPFNLFADQNYPFVLSDDNDSVLLGTVFPNNGSEPTRWLSHQSKLTASDICKSAWGEYVFFRRGQDGSELSILRDPSGAISCYLWHNGDVIVVMSEASIARDLALTKGIFDWQSIASSLAFPGLRSEKTGLIGITEVLPGTNLQIKANSLDRSTAWAPGAFVHPQDAFSTYADATHAIRESISKVASKLGSLYPRILLELSGGLDSSIIAAALSGAHCEVFCQNVKTWDGGADEVHYARQVADHLDYAFEHHEIDDTSPVAQVSSPSFRPGMDTLQQIVDQVFCERGHHLGVDAFFTGAGGDNVFCYLKNATPALDAVRARRPLIFWRAVKDLAHMHQCSIWKILRLVTRKLRHPRPRFWKTDRSYLTGLYLTSEAIHHPWLSEATTGLPGRREHIESLLWSQNYRDAMNRSTFAPVILPLLAQPVMETCLRVPTWMWVSEGRNRACARSAFEDSLPACVLNRRSKGNFLGVYTHAYETDRDRLMDTLTNGHLARAGILDRTQVKAALQNPLIARDHGFLRLMELAKTEAWMDEWAGHGRSV